MSLKNFKKGNLFYIIDTVTNKPYQKSAAEVDFSHRLYSGIETFRFLNIPTFPEGRVVAFSEILNEAGVAYADLATFITFLDENTGKSNPGAAGSGELKARKTADETKNNDAVAVIDDDLKVVPEANSFYFFHIFLIYSASSTPDFRIKMITPAGSIIKWNNDIGNKTGALFGETSQTSLISSGGNPKICHIMGTIETTAIVGDFGLGWAQWNSDAGNTILFKNSSLIATKLN